MFFESQGRPRRLKRPNRLVFFYEQEIEDTRRLFYLGGSCRVLLSFTFYYINGALLIKFLKKSTADPKTFRITFRIIWREERKRVG